MSLAELVLRFRTRLALVIYGGAGATGMGAVQHMAQSCAGGSCSGCGSCVAALGAAVAAASTGAGLGRHARAWLAGTVALVAAAVGLAVYLL